MSKPLEQHTRKELIQIIRVYNNENIIRGYHAMKKVQLINAIRKHININEEGQVEAKANPIKPYGYDEFKTKLANKKTKALLSGKQELKLARARGKQRGIIAKIDDQLEGLNEELSNDFKLKKDKAFMKELAELEKQKETEKAKLKTIQQLFKKHNEAVAKATEANK